MQNMGKVLQFNTNSVKTFVFSVVTNQFYHMVVCQRASEKAPNEENEGPSQALL